LRYHPQFATRNTQLASRTPHLASRNPQPAPNHPISYNPFKSIRNLKSAIAYPAPRIAKTIKISLDNQNFFWEIFPKYISSALLFCPERGCFVISGQISDFIWCRFECPRNQSDENAQSTFCRSRLNHSGGWLFEIELPEAPIHMTDQKNQVLHAAIVRILRPLIYILIRNGISYGTFADLAKWLFVDVAKREFAIEARKQSVSRVSVITGLNRKEVKRMFELPVPDDQASSERYNRAARVIAGWRRDKMFRDDEGNPADVAVSGEGATFQALVKKYSGDMPFRAVLDELIRVGAASQTKDGRVHLIARAYLPAGDDSMKIHILGTDVAQLISSIRHNLEPDNRGPFYQRKVMYDNLPDEVLPAFRKLSAESAQKLLEKLDGWLSKRDRDTGRKVKGRDRNVAGLGICYFEEPYEEKDE